MMWNSGFPFMGFAGGLGMLLFLALVIVGILWIVQSTSRTTGQNVSSAPQSEGPLDILKRRYASGELTKEQFDNMQRDLK